MKSKPKTSSFTPGPWKIEEQSRDLWIVNALTATSKLLAQINWEDDQKEYRFSVSKSEAKANAHLIAASPALLEVCKRTSEFCSRQLKNTHRAMPHNFAILGAMADEAISKAEQKGDQNDKARNLNRRNGGCLERRN